MSSNTSDHIKASYGGKLSPSGAPQPNGGAYAHIQESFRYKDYGFKYEVDDKVEFFYFDKDGMAFGKTLPMIGMVLCAKFHYKDVYIDAKHVGVHYHYEIIAGSSHDNFFSKKAAEKLSKHFTEESMEAWNLHNSIEVGCFENFLVPLYQQRSNMDDLHYSLSMDPVADNPTTETGFDKALFDCRVKGYRACNDPFDFQRALHPSFL